MMNGKVKGLGRQGASYRLGAPLCCCVVYNMKATAKEGNTILSIQTESSGVVYMLQDSMMYITQDMNEAI